MPFTIVLDSDGLIKLAKAGILAVAIRAWRCLIPEAVYAETVERGIRAGYPDAEAIREALPPTIVRARVRHPRATALLGQKRGLGAGEREALHLFLTVQADAIVSDDAAFVAMLVRTGCPYLLPASVLVRLTQQGHLEPGAAREALERMRPLIRPEVYQAARADLGALPSRKAGGANGGTSV